MIDCVTQLARWLCRLADQPFTLSLRDSLCRWGIVPSLDGRAIEGARGRGAGLHGSRTRASTSPIARVFVGA